MKNYSIVCKVTGTVLENDLTFTEANKTLENYCFDDYGSDIEEVLNYCERTNTSLLDYFIKDHFYSYDNLLHPIERYSLIFNEIKEYSLRDCNLNKLNVFNWFYDKHETISFQICDGYGTITGFGWDFIKESINWEIVDEKEIVLSLLQKGSYEYQDFCDSFTIVIL